MTSEQVLIQMRIKY